MIPSFPPVHRPAPWYRELPLLLRHAARELADNDPLRLGAATAFFTSFALPPILIILIQLLRALYPTSLVRTMLLDKLSGVLGKAATGLIEQILSNVTDPMRTRTVTWAGFVFLVFIATTLFTVIQHSLNQLWQIRPRRSSGPVALVLRERLRSGGVLLATGVLTVLAFATDATLSLFTDAIRDFDITLVYYVVRTLNSLAALTILAVWFGLIFRTLSLAKVPWQAVRRGAVLTAVLISLGETVLGKLLVGQDLGPVYGPAAGLVLVLLFVFYCAMIFYFGAAFTKVYALRIGLRIRPKKTAVRYRLVNVDDDE